MARTAFPRLFAVVSLVVLVTDAAFLTVNYVTARSAYHRTLHQEGEKLRSGFEVAMAMTYANMLQLATFIGSDPAIQATVLEGRLAVDAEGGGAGGERAAAARRRLADQVQTRWEAMQREFGVRQLHFHLAPGSLSFLRVHAPNKFGDRMDDLRHIIVDTNRDRQPRTGLETGRIYTGLRGVTPLMAADPEKSALQHVGAVEVGSSFEPILDTLDRRLGAGVAILLAKEHVDQAMWTEFIRRYLPGSSDSNCSCYVEATSRETIYRIIGDPLFQSYRGQSVTLPVQVGSQTFGVTRFPLHDYLGMRDQGRAPVGSVVVWADNSATYGEFREGQVFNLIYGVFAFLLVELLLWGALRFGAARLRKELAVRTAQLERSNAELSNFASIVSHDLQAPLRQVVIYLGLIERKLLGKLDEEAREYLDFAIGGGKRMSQMISELLAFSRIGRQPQAAEPVALDAVVATVLRDLSSMIAETGADIAVEGPLPVVRGVPGDIARLMTNLLGNALKYRAPDRPPVIRVSCRRDDGVWRISVADNGSGIREELHDRIFDLFQRGDQANMVDGTGIGLAVAKRIVEMQGGHIWVEPNPEGRGSLFRFTLPGAE